VIVLTWLSLWARFREGEAVEPLPPSGLNLWDLPGCYRLMAQPWPEGPPDVAPVPEYLMLVPDSLDEWGRVQPTYRARPLDEAGAPPYRWFVRADTLWVVWADRRVPAGLALRESSDGMLGRVRVGRPGDSVDVTARVQAWKVNCSTRELESSTRLRR